MDAPVTPVTSGKPRSRIRVQNFVAVEGPNMSTTEDEEVSIIIEAKEQQYFNANNKSGL